MSMLSKSSEETLAKYFQFDRIFNLYDYDHDMARLHSDLVPLVRNCYEPNYRFIFLLYDTQYHISNHEPGLTLCNLQRICHDLDIPNYFCLVLSHHDVSDQLKRLAKSETTDDCAIDSLCHYNYYAISQWNSVENIDLGLQVNAESIVAKYQSLNRIKRFHRRALMALLRHRDLLKHGMVSYNHLGANGARCE